MLNVLSQLKEQRWSGSQLGGCPISLRFTALSPGPLGTLRRDGPNDVPPHPHPFWSFRGHHWRWLRRRGTPMSEF
ncbi:hypothetical protein JZ751_012526 [Albula glossodonta]|uniref:Uncharacterized protein n=1 Tax=Albula glossodonta TaxID=121402 RepID=A0A8T2NV38_9TELE|nr:hypothetical protein JZ751_012526 [Albula glossodonta]